MSSRHARNIADILWVLAEALSKRQFVDLDISFIDKCIFASQLGVEGHQDTVGGVICLQSTAYTQPRACIDLHSHMA